MSALYRNRLSVISRIIKHIIMPQNIYFPDLPIVKLPTHLVKSGFITGFPISSGGEYVPEDATTDMAIRNQKSVSIGIWPKLNWFCMK